MRKSRGHRSKHRTSHTNFSQRSGRPPYAYELTACGQTQGLGYCEPWPKQQGSCTKKSQSDPAHPHVASVRLHQRNPLNAFFSQPATFHLDAPTDSWVRARGANNLFNGYDLSTFQVTHALTIHGGSGSYLNLIYNPH